MKLLIPGVKDVAETVVPGGTMKGCTTCTSIEYPLLASSVMGALPLQLPMGADVHLLSVCMTQSTEEENWKVAVVFGLTEILKFLQSPVGTEMPTVFRSTMAKAPGTGVGVGVGVGLGAAAGEALGVGLGAAAGEALGVGLGAAVGEGTGVGLTMPKVNEVSLTF